MIRIYYHISSTYREEKIMTFKANPNNSFYHLTNDQANIKIPYDSKSPPVSSANRSAIRYEGDGEHMKKSLLGSFIFIILGLILAYAPLPGIFLIVIVPLCINCIAAMGVSLLTGYTGIFTLGHAAYMALGAYTAAIMTMRYGFHWLPAIIAGGGVATLVGWMIGVPTLRLTGDYYAIASIGLGESIRLILDNWQSFTGGARGFPGIALYTNRVMAVAFLTVLGIIMFNLIESRLGRELKASRDDRTAASLMGFNTPNSRMKALLISAFYCGIAGGLFAGYSGFIQPVAFNMMKSTEITAVVVFGGLGSMSGTLLGTGFITWIMEAFRNISKYRMLIYGLILAGVMVLRPEGLLGNREIWYFIPGLRPGPAKRRD
jgi:branched-chain amino acid transport system permease protein